MTDLDEQRDAAEERANASLKYVDADWTDTLRELARFASDQELAAPLTITCSGDDPRHVSVAVSGPAHAAWFEHFNLGHGTSGNDDVAYHVSSGELPSGAWVTLHCLADMRLPSAVAS
jgi:hypothetical protein